MVVPESYNLRVCLEALTLPLCFIMAAISRCLWQGV
jgi:hypothetical protein